MAVAYSATCELVNRRVFIASQTFVVLTATMVLTQPCASGVTFPEKPTSEHYYVDGAGIVDQSTGEQIDSKAAALLSEEKVPLYVVTIRSLADQDAVTHSIEDYAAELFNHWGIGSQDRNYGMLLLISEGDRKARIELGAGWERNYDYQATQVMNDLIVPAFKRGDFQTGISDGVRGMDAMARGLDLPSPKSPWWLWPALIGGLILVIAVIINLFRTGRSGWGWALLAALGVVLFFVIRSAMSNSGSSGGFGGGSSGGGGATGSW